MLDASEMQKLCARGALAWMMQSAAALGESSADHSELNRRRGPWLKQVGDFDNADRYPLTHVFGKTNWLLTSKTGPVPESIATQQDELQMARQPHQPTCLELAPEDSSLTAAFR